MSRALVILSGGQDSTTVLFKALRENDEVHAVTFDYGQRHVVELESASRVAVIANVVTHEIIRVPQVLIGSSPLVNQQENVEQYASADVLPGGLEKTFVPGRNMLFLVLAANRAYNLRADRIYIGVSQEDYGGYPDCRSDFINMMETAIKRGLRFDDVDPFDPVLMTPLIFLNKKQTVELAQTLGDDCWQALAYSHTCYNGAVPPCGKCHACLLRERGFKEAGVKDPLLERLGVS